MIMAPEQAALKAKEQFDSLLGLVQKAVRDGDRIDTLERDLMRRLLSLGHTLLSAFVAQHGDGDLGPEARTAEGRTARRLPERHDRRYVSIFGELTITRAATASVRARGSSECRWTNDWACPRANSHTSWRIGPSGSA